jgi:hypothetical protein
MFGVEYKSSSTSLCNFLNSSYLAPLRSKYLSQHPIHKHFSSLCSSIILRDQV